MENTEVLTSDISTVTEQDNREQQEATGTGSTDRSQERVANKAGFNQLSLKRARFEMVAEGTQNAYELHEELAKYANKSVYLCLIKV